MTDVAESVWPRLTRMRRVWGVGSLCAELIADVSVTPMRLTSMAAIVRRIRAGEGSVLKTIRLAALADSRSAFGSSYAAEADQPTDYCQLRAELGAAGEHSVTLFAIVDGSVVGLVAAHQPDPTGPSVELVSMWVAPTQRRAGIAAELVGSRHAARAASMVMIRTWTW